MSSIQQPVPILEFGPAFAAGLAAAEPAEVVAPYRRSTALRPADAREARSHLGEAAETVEVLAVVEPADFDATPPALPSMADWIEGQARAIRLNSSDLAWWLAERVDEIARECRFLRAEMPDQFDARSEVMATVHGEPGGRPL